MKKVTREELLRSPEFWEEYIKSNLFELIQEYLDKPNHSQTELAKKMGASRGYISQVLKGESDHRLSKIIELALAVDKAPYIYLKDIDKVIEADRKGNSVFLDFDQLETKVNRCDRLEKNAPTTEEFDPIDTLERISSEEELNAKDSATVIPYAEFKDSSNGNDNCSTDDYAKIG